MDQVEVALVERRRGGGWRVSRRGRSPGIGSGRGSRWRSRRRAMSRCAPVGRGSLAGAEADDESRRGGVEAQVLEVRKRLEENAVGAGRRAAIAWELSSLAQWCRPSARSRNAGACRRHEAQRPARRASKDSVSRSGAAGGSAGAGRPGRAAAPGRSRALPRSNRSTWPPPRRDQIVGDRGDQRIVLALHALWRRHGVPERIQFDNSGPFCSPTGLGEIVRVCLRQDSTQVFIRPGSRGATARSSTSTTPSTSSSSARNASPTSRA